MTNTKLRVELAFAIQHIEQLLTTLRKVYDSLDKPTKRKQTKGSGYGKV